MRKKHWAMGIIALVIALVASLFVHQQAAEAYTDSVCTKTSRPKLGVKVCFERSISKTTTYRGYRLNYFKVYIKGNLATLEENKSLKVHSMAVYGKTRTLCGPKYFSLSDRRGQRSQKVCKNTRFKRPYGEIRLSYVLRDNGGPDAHGRYSGTIVR